MRFLIGTAAAIKAKNHQEALDRDCDPNGVTQQWYEVRHISPGMSCLMIDDDKNIPGSTTDEPDWETSE